MPLNNSCIQIPTFHEFIKDNRGVLEKALGYLKKLAQSVKGECLFVEHNFRIEDIFWELSDVCLLLAEYEGRLKPKHYDISTELLEHHLAESKINKLNLLLEANKFL
jgi:hypothetical protein